MVHIYLNVPDSQALSPFLSIPLNDVQRLSVRPFKWLRYVLYSICGAKGDLSEIPEGPSVDYEATMLADDVTYYYNPSENCIFVDHECLNDNFTTSTSELSGGLRWKLLERDRSMCVITQTPIFDAVHLIPRSKSDEYIKRVVEIRSPLYGDMAPPVLRIDAVENGVLLRKDLYPKLSRGDVAFLKTPNYGLDCTDIQRPTIAKVGQGPAPTDTFTLHQLVEPHYYDPDKAEYLAFALYPSNVALGLGLNVDAQFQGTSLLPHTIILDYVYGVAAYKQWNSRRDTNSVHDVMRSYHQVISESR